jgi:hypothetical protein
MEQKSGLKHFGGFWGFLKRGFSSGPAHFLTKNVPGACCSWRIVATSSVALHSIVQPVACAVPD